MTPFLDAYFARIDFAGKPDVSIDTLRSLHALHNAAIPFENLDVVLPREIELTDEAIFNKLVVARRGGYCFEQNGLFERVLREIGFNVRSLLGRVVLSNPAQMPPRTHRVLLVTLDDQQWLADVGFGGQTLTAPVRLAANIEQETPHGLYRLQPAGTDWILQFRHHEKWQSMYQLEIGPQYQADFVMGNFHSAHWPQSHFRHHLLMCRHFTDGSKLTLTNFHFTWWKAGQVIKEIVAPDARSLHGLLQEHFGQGADHPQYGFSADALEVTMSRFNLHEEGR
ncbi:arylamine N-acetyltransferase [Phytobacter sp. V91]|uniref:arylamine N-acetyltransferase n=1 Tax=Phytobacter sp. V91 TaxID=3369425 RepID=UPI003F634887